MRTVKSLLCMTGILLIASCSNNAPKTENTPGLNRADTTRRDHTELGNPDIGGSEMHNQGTDSMGQQTTGGK